MNGQKRRRKWHFLNSYQTRIKVLATFFTIIIHIFNDCISNTFNDLWNHMSAKYGGWDYDPWLQSSRFSYKIVFPRGTWQSNCWSFFKCICQCSTRNVLFFHLQKWEEWYKNVFKGIFFSFWCLIISPRQVNKYK